jgi:starch-binding outer membrane protein, SusD/RagB family
MMKRLIFPLLLLVFGVTACSDFLDEQPKDEIPSDGAITDLPSAQAFLAGAYAGLQEDSYYGGDFELFGDLSSDNAQDIGTFNSYKDAERHNLQPTNVSISDIWSAIYIAIGRANTLINDVPGVITIDQADKDEIVGEALTLRALHYHNLVKLFGGVPLVLKQPGSIDEANGVVRATSDEVYAQIESDLTQAETLISNQTAPTTSATLGGAKALLARVYLYEGKYTEANAKADEVIGLGYDLAPAYADLFPDDENDTVEDIWKVTFTDVQFNYMYYWWSDPQGGGAEVAPTADLMSAYAPNDDRRARNFCTTTDPLFCLDTPTSGDTSGAKYPTTAGAEDIHVIRFAEVLLIKAEALAHLNQLAAAVDEYNKVRVRAGLAPHTLGNQVTSQQDVLDEIDLQRRLELFAEADRWPDLVRTGRWQQVLPGIPSYQTLYPIPQNEIDVAGGLIQNPGY